MTMQNEVGFETDVYEVLIEEDFNLTNKIRIKKTPFDGVMFRIGSVNPIEVGGQLQINYTYEIVDPAGHTFASLERNPTFIELMNKILSEFLNKYLAWLRDGKRGSDD